MARTITYPPELLPNAGPDDDAEVIVMPSIPRGKYIGKVKGEPPKDEAEHFYKCGKCGAWVDYRDLGMVFDHEPGGSHPKENQAQ